MGWNCCSVADIFFRYWLGIDYKKDLRRRILVHSAGAKDFPAGVRDIPRPSIHISRYYTCIYTEQLPFVRWLKILWELPVRTRWLLFCFVESQVLFHKSYILLPPATGRLQCWEFFNTGSGRRVALKGTYIDFPITFLNVIVCLMVCMKLSVVHRSRKLAHASRIGAPQ